MLNDISREPNAENDCVIVNFHRWLLTLDGQYLQLTVSSDQWLGLDWSTVELVRFSGVL